MASFPPYTGEQLRRPLQVGSTLPNQHFSAPLPVQLRPVMHTHHSYEFIPSSIQQFQPIGQASNIGMPQTSISHFAEPIPMSYVQQNRHLLPPVTVQAQQNSQLQDSHLFKLGGGGMPISSSYAFPASYGQQLSSIDTPSQYRPISQIQASVTSAEGQPWLPSGTQNVPSVQAAQQSSAQALIFPAPDIAKLSSDWQEHTSPAGKRYYYNSKTKQSSWVKPVELMTATERADASTEWKEYTTPEGRKFFYNKVTKQSKWTIPDEVKAAREQTEKVGIQPPQSEGVAAPHAPPVSHPSVEIPSTSTAIINPGPVTSAAVATNPFSVGLVVSSVNPESMLASTSSSIASLSSSGLAFNSVLGSTKATIELNVSTSATTLPASFPASTMVIDDITYATQKTPNVSSASVGDDLDVTSQDLDEVKKGVASVVNGTLIPREEKPILEEPWFYASKLEAKNAFKCLLESADVESDWTWEQAMRVIINDKRYGALKTLGERKNAFNEYLGERKKQELEEKSLKQKKTHEDFIKMLEESQEVTTSTKWSKVLAMFEGDERFTAIERTRDCEDLFESYVLELRKKVRVRAAEEHKRNVMEYRAFLGSCDFIKANSMWRKVQDRLESDERCSRLDKFDRLYIFQDYVNDLEKEEEELQKIQKEQLRKVERKNRDDFRKLMEQHVAAGVLTAKTHWRDYYMEVKDLASYLAVSSNTSGATPKDLFGDVLEELEKQYGDDKTRIKDALKIRKITLVLSSTFEIFKAAILEDDSLRVISEINLKLIFDELLGKLRDREEKEAKRRQSLADSFSNMLYSVKEISASSTWEECKSLFEDCQYSSIGEEKFMREIFEEYVAHLQAKANEERKRVEGKAKKEKGRDDKEKRRDRNAKAIDHEKEKGDKEKRRDRNAKAIDHEKEKGKRGSKTAEKVIENGDGVDIRSLEDRRRGEDKDRKRRKHHHSTTDVCSEKDVNVEKDVKEKSKSSQGHSSERKKSRKHPTESESENRHKRWKKDHDGSHRYNSYEVEDKELREDRQVRKTINGIPNFY